MATILGGPHFGTISPAMQAAGAMAYFLKWNYLTYR